MKMKNDKILPIQIAGKNTEKATLIHAGVNA